MDELFPIPEDDGSIEFVICGDRTYWIKPTTFRGEDCFVISWTEVRRSLVAIETRDEHGWAKSVPVVGTCTSHGVVGGHHKDQHAALAAIDIVEAARANR